MLDGDLAAAEAEALRRRADADPGLHRSMEDWQRIGGLLRDDPVEGVPDPEVAWAGVRRAIRAGAPAEGVDVPSWRLRWAVGAVAATVVAILALGGWRVLRLGDAPMLARGTPAVVEWVEAELPGASPMVFEDEETGCTVIWMVVAEEGGAGTPAKS
jgi:anti-sigma-K factor RskA